LPARRGATPKVLKALERIGPPGTRLDDDDLPESDQCVRCESPLAFDLQLGGTVVERCTNARCVNAQPRRLTPTTPLDR
jgi:hypothetical protein